MLGQAPCLCWPLQGKSGELFAQVGSIVLLEGGSWYHVNAAYNSAETASETRRNTATEREQGRTRITHPFGSLPCMEGVESYLHKWDPQYCLRGLQAPRVCRPQLSRDSF